MMLPFFRFNMPAPKIWQGRSAPPTRFRSKFSFQAERARVVIGFSGVTTAAGWFPPAAFTRTVTGPSSFSTFCSACSRAFGSKASTDKKMAFPCLESSLALASPLSLFLPKTATLAPASANPSAIAPPRPPVPPMTTATSPVRSNRGVVFMRGSY